jgi:hypothetical protein
MKNHKHMNNILILIGCFAGLSIGSVLAQPPSKVAQEQLKKLEYWQGDWKGEASIRRGPGEPTKINQQEHIEFRLEGTVLLIEGIGKSPVDGSKIFNALAIINYDETSNQFKMKSYLQEGKSTDAWFNVTADNTYEWGFDVPSGKIKYTISLDPSKGTWNEKGAYSPDGNNWMPFMEMNLKKVR